MLSLVALGKKRAANRSVLRLVYTQNAKKGRASKCGLQRRRSQEASPSISYQVRSLWIALRLVEYKLGEDETHG